MRLAPLLAASLLLTVLTAGCGGGSGGGGRSSNNLDGLTINFNTGATGTVSDTDRAAAEAAIDKEWASVSALPINQQTMALSNAMKTIKVFKSGAYSTDGEVCGEYTDGVLESWVLNDPYVATTPITGTGALKTQTASTSTGVAKPADELPATNQAYVFNALEASRNFPVAVISSELTGAGFTVDATKLGSISDWLSVSKAAVLVVGGHGDLGLTPDGTPVFFQETTDLKTTALDTTYASQLKSKQIEYMAVREYGPTGTLKDQNGATYNLVRHYAISSAFLASNSSMFAKNSLMYNSACKGSIQPAYTNSLESTNGLSVYYGWNQSTGDEDSGASAVFMVDRLLGLDRFPPVDPSNPPPATFAQVYAKMQSTDRDTAAGSYPYDTSMVSSSFGRTVTARLIQSTSSSNDLGTIVPSISTATDTNGSVVLTGHFGSFEGTLDLAGAPLTVTKWIPGEIDATTTLTSGMLQATVNGLKGNTVPLPVISLTPMSATVTPGGTPTEFTVTPPAGVTGTLQWDWSTTGSTAQLTDEAGNQGQSIVTSAKSVFLVTTPVEVGSFTVTVKGFIKNADGSTTPIGTAVAQVTLQALKPDISYTFTGDWGTVIGTPDATYTWSGVAGDRQTLTDNNGKPVDRIMLDYDLIPDPQNPGSSVINTMLDIWVPVGQALTEGETFTYTPSTAGGFEIFIPTAQNGATQDPLLSYTAGTITSAKLTISQVTGTSSSGSFHFTLTCTDSKGGTFNGSGADSFTTVASP